MSKMLSSIAPKQTVSSSLTLKPSALSSVAPKPSVLKLAVMALVFALVLSGCTAAGTDVQPDMDSQESLAVDDKSAQRAKAMVEQMTLRDKVTQMLMVDFRDWRESDSAATGSAASAGAAGSTAAAPAAEATDFTVMNDEVRSIIEDYNFGAIILFADNIKETEQSFNLVADMQKAATADGGIPLLISADQEGGSVYRLGAGTALPGNMALGATYASSGTKYALEAGKIIGSELGVLGINTALAPVVDVNNNANNPVIGLRSFGDDATMVGELAAASIAGMAEFSVIGCAKHFPGHGDTAVDSHYGLPVVDKPLSVLLENELKPYEVAIDQGIEMIMAAHILYPQLEGDTLVSEKTGKAESLPATMSDDILTGLLKEQMGFDGVVVTDAMNMAGIADSWDQVQAVVLAIAAGVDMVCMPCNLSSVDDLAALDAIIDGVIAAVDAGDIPRSRIDDAVTRILTVKESRGILDYNPANYSLEKAKATVGCEANRSMEREMSAAAVTVIKNIDGAFPLKLTAESKVLMLAAYDNEPAQMLMAWNRGVEAGAVPEGAEVDYFRFDSEEISPELGEKLEWADVLIIISEVPSASSMGYAHWLSAMPNKLCDYALANGKTSVIVSCDKPYDVQLYPSADVILATYGCKGSSVDPTEALIGGVTGAEAACGPNIIAAVEVALGAFEAQGRLPLDIPLFDAASGAYASDIAYQRGFGLS